MPPARWRPSKKPRSSWPLQRQLLIEALRSPNTLRIREQIAAMIFDPVATAIAIQFKITVPAQESVNRGDPALSLAPLKATRSQSFGRRLPTPRSREAIIFSREDGVDAFPARSRLYAHRYDRAALQRLLTESLAGRAQPGDGEKAGTTEATNVRHRHRSGRTRAARPLSS
jgi:hypothetical protein